MRALSLSHTQIVQQSSTGTAVGGVSPVLNAGTGVGVGVVGVGGGAGVPVVAYGASSSHASTLSEDFVLLSEFSEQEGPIPLMTIPKSAIDDQSQIDFSGFVVRTMAVDHQARVGYAAPSFHMGSHPSFTGKGSPSPKTRACF